MSRCCGRKAPEGDVGFGERRFLGDAGDREAQPVVARGADRDRDRDRDVEDRHDEGEAGRFFGTRFERVDRGRAQQVVRIAFVVGVDHGDQPDLGVRRALLQGEVVRRALGQHPGVAEHALAAASKADVLGDFRVAVAAQLEVGVEIRMPPGLPRWWLVVVSNSSIGSAALRRSGADRERQQARAAGRAELLRIATTPLSGRAAARFLAPPFFLACFFLRCIRASSRTGRAS